jgi:hypothetical protein
MAVKFAQRIVTVLRLFESSSRAVDAARDACCCWSMASRIG